MCDETMSRVSQAALKHCSVLELLAFQRLPLSDGIETCFPACLLYVVLGLDLRASGMLGKQSGEAHPQNNCCFIFKYCDNVRL